MSLKLLTLNIEGDRHLDRVAAALAAHRPDVACLQEVLEKDIPYLAASGGYDVEFSPRARVLDAAKGVENQWGIAVFSRVPIRAHAVGCYSADPQVWVLREPDDARSVLIATELEHAGTPYRILTTHFTWSEHGQISDRQIADFRRLKAFLAEFPDYVLCGDFNAPRGRAMFSMFTDQLPVVDHLPAHVMTTIDPRHHRAGALDLAVDNIFSTRDYEVRDVQVLDDLSDHMGILASVGRLKDSPQ